MKTETARLFLLSLVHACGERELGAAYFPLAGGL